MEMHLKLESNIHSARLYQLAKMLNFRVCLWVLMMTELFTKTFNLSESGEISLSIP